MTPNEEESPKSMPIYSKEYNSEDSDITLISSDDVNFRIHSYMLKAHSIVLRDLLNDPLMKTAPIPLDVSSSDLTRFLDLMYLPEPSIPFNWIETKKILDLSLKYECYLINERIRIRLNLQYEQEPWEIFILSSHFNDLTLAKKTLSFMGRDSNKRWLSLKSISITEANQPTLPYLLGLLKAIDKVYKGNPPTPASYEQPKWAQVAEQFQPLLE